MPRKKKQIEPIIEKPLIEKTIEAIADEKQFFIQLTFKQFTAIASTIFIFMSGSGYGAFKYLVNKASQTKIDNCTDEVNKLKSRMARIEQIQDERDFLYINSLYVMKKTIYEQTRKGADLQELIRVQNAYVEYLKYTTIHKKENETEKIGFNFFSDEARKIEDVYFYIPKDVLIKLQEYDEKVKEKSK